MPLLLDLFVKTNIKNKIGDIQQIYSHQNVLWINFQQCWLISMHLFIKCKFILFYLIFITTFYTWFSTHSLSQPVHCLSAKIRSLSAHPILPLPQNHTFTIKTSASYLWTSKLLNFRTWNSPTFRRFQLSAILFAFLQTNLDGFFWKVPTSYYFQSYYIIKNIFSMGNRPHSQQNRRSGMRHCLHVFCGLYLGYPTKSTKVVNSSHCGCCLTRLKSRTTWEGLIL